MTTDMVRHGVKNAVQGNKRFPFVLMLEPLYTCNLACLGCAKERHTGKLKDRLSVEACLQAVEECGAPTVSICGGEPTIYPELPELIAGIIERRRTSTSAPTRCCSTRRCSASSRRTSA